VKLTTSVSRLLLSSFLWYSVAAKYRQNKNSREGITLYNTNQRNAHKLVISQLRYNAHCKKTQMN